MNSGSGMSEKAKVGDMAQPCLALVCDWKLDRASVVKEAQRAWMSPNKKDGLCDGAHFQS